MLYYNLIKGKSISYLQIISAVVNYRIDLTFPYYLDVCSTVEEPVYNADFYVFTKTGMCNRECWCGCTWDTCKEYLCVTCRLKNMENNPLCVKRFGDEIYEEHEIFAFKFTEEQKAFMNKIDHRDEDAIKELSVRIKELFGNV